MKLPLYKLKDNSNDHTKTTKHGEQSSASGTSFPGSFAPRDIGKRDPWNELARTGQARFCVIEKQSKFYCKGFWRKSVLFWFSSHCNYTMICWFCFRFSTEIPTAILSSITSLPGLSRPCTSVFILEPGMDGYPWEPRFMDAQVLNDICF